MSLGAFRPRCELEKTTRRMFLDKVPVVVGADSTLAGAIHKANELQKHGLGYLEMEARAVAAGEPPTLPPLHEARAAARASTR